MIAKPYTGAGVVKKAMLWNPEDRGYFAVYVAKRMIDGTMPKSGSFEAGRLGRVKLISEDEILLGDPLDYTKRDVGRYKF